MLMSLLKSFDLILHRALAANVTQYWNRWVDHLEWLWFCPLSDKNAQMLWKTLLKRQRALRLTVQLHNLRYIFTDCRKLQNKANGSL